MLAIVIPYYKSTYFEETLLSIANQTDKRFKVYIGDDSSIYNPLGLLNVYINKIDLNYHRFEINLGNISLTKQWERCINLTQNEEWLMVLGDDDVLEHNVVEEFYAIVDKDNIDLIRFKLQTIDENGNVKSLNSEHKVFETSHDLLESMFCSKETITASEFIFRREVYIEHNGFVEFPLAWFSDNATWLTFSKQKGVYNIQHASVYWRLSGVNISSSSSDIKSNSMKVKSLFMFMFFLQNNFEIDSQKLKAYAHSKLIDILHLVPFYKNLTILSKELFVFKFKYTDLIILEFILKRVKYKIKKTYEGFYTP
jgi:glycosyltransferase involved in cell wall biosynthesis